jgi:hypothetical protein
VPNGNQRFERLAAQFEMIEHNLSDCQEPEQRRELLRRMLIVIKELDQLILNDVPWLRSKLASTAPTNRLLVKAAHK